MILMKEENEDYPMTEGQRNNLYDLIGTAILTPDQKDAYYRCLDCKLTYNEAEGLQQELRAIQLDPLSQDVGKIYRSELNKSLKKLVERPNT